VTGSNAVAGREVKADKLATSTLDQLAHSGLSVLGCAEVYLLGSIDGPSPTVPFGDTS
jgi:hypothetical protein